MVRFTLFCFFLGLIQVMALDSYSQQTRISLNQHDQRLEDVLKTIEDRSEFFFLYNRDLINVDQKVNINASNQTIKVILDELLKGTDISYSIVNRQIILSNLEGNSGLVSQQQKSVSGKVSDSAGAPLPGVSVVVKGTTNGSITDSNGSFTLSRVSENSTLIFSFIGMKTQEVVVGGKETITVTLAEESYGIDEVVAIGYGTMKKSDLTGSLTSVRSENLTAFPTTTMQQALQGRAAGVYVMPKTGEPGGEINIRIRGTNSIQGGNEPLYVIDGFPYNGVPTISNNDVESIEILKDASATAIYGSRGANGVVLISTKRGKSGKTTINFSSSYSLNSIRHKLPLMNGTEYAQTINKMFVNDGQQPYFQNPESLGEGTDWQDLIFRTAPLLDNDVTINGGNDKTRFSFGTGYYDEEGIIRNNDYNKLTLRMNLDHKLSDKFDFSFSSNYSNINNGRQSSGGGERGSSLIGALIGMPPTLKPYNDDGTLLIANRAYPFISDGIVNPLNFTDEMYNRIHMINLLINGAITYKPTKGLSVKISAGIQNQESRNDYYVTKKSVNSNGFAAIGVNSMQSILNENIINYTKKINEIHDFSITGGVTYQDYTFKSVGASGSGFASDITETSDLGSSETIGNPASGMSEWVLFSYLGRLNYSFKNRYLFTASFRADGSSRYSVGNKWGYFPSGAIAWKVKEEEFMKNVGTISDLKLRLSYGETGSTAISPYRTLNLLTSGKSILNDDLVTTFAPSTRMPGPLRWESTAQTNIGLDLGLFKNRIRLTSEYYIKKTTGLLNDVQLPSSTGYASTTQNIGELQNKGFDFNIDANVTEGKFLWNISGNISFNRNKVLSLANHQLIRGSGINVTVINDFVNIIKEGSPLGIFYGYIEDGYDANGKIKFKDLNNDGKLTFDDKVQIGDPYPKFTAGLNSTMTYGNLELNLFFYGSYGNDIYNTSKVSVNMDYLPGLNKTRDLLNDSWTPENQNAKYPKLSKVSPVQVSGRYVEDGSYLKLKNIQLAYKIPFKKLGLNLIDNGQIYVSGQNLLTLTKYSWYDPEVNSWGGSNSVNIGIDHLSYPTSKGVTMGLKLVF